MIASIKESIPFLNKRGDSMQMPFDMRFENNLIKEYAQDTYEEFLSHAERRQLEPDYVVEKFISELQKLARKDGYIK